MSTTALNTLRDQVSLSIPRCPVPYVLAALRQTAVEFFRDSEVWRKELAAISSVASQAAYKMVLGESSVDPPDVWRIVTIEDQGVPLEANTYNLDFKETTTGVYDYYFEFLTDYIPSTAVTNRYVPTVVLVPSASGGTMDVAVLNAWSRALTEGTLGTLFSMRSRPWSDAAEAAVHSNAYQGELASARRERTQQFTTDGELKARNPEGWL